MSKKKGKDILAPAKGLVISWKDTAVDRTESSVIDHNVTHKNPVYRLMARDIFNTLHKLIVRERRLKWHIDVTTVFEMPNGDKENLTGFFVVWCTSGEVAEDCVRIHEENLREGNTDHFAYTEFTATCLAV